jgi:hypothetical protein
MKRDRTDWSDTLPAPDNTPAGRKHRDEPVQRRQTRVLRPVLWLLAALAVFQLSKIGR